MVNVYRICRFFIVSFILFWILPSFVLSATIYIGQTNCQTSTSPFPTRLSPLCHGLGLGTWLVKTGDFVVYLYYPTPYIDESLSIVAKNNIFITGELGPNGQLPTVSGTCPTFPCSYLSSSKKPGPIFYFDRASNVTLTKLRITGDSRPGIIATNSNGLKFTGLNISFLGGSPLTITGGKNHIISYNDISYGGLGALSITGQRLPSGEPDAVTNVTGVTITGNIFSNMPKSGLMVATNSFQVFVTNNFFHHICGPAYYGDESQNTTVMFNLFRDGDKIIDPYTGREYFCEQFPYAWNAKPVYVGLAFLLSVGDQGTKQVGGQTVPIGNCINQNNIIAYNIVERFKGGLTIWHESSCKLPNAPPTIFRNITFANNIITGIYQNITFPSWKADIVNDAAVVSNVIIANNVLLDGVWGITNVNGGSIAGWNITHNHYYNIQKSVSLLGKNVTTGSPLFVNAGASNYQTLVGSPLRNSGTLIKYFIGYIPPVVGPGIDRGVWEGP